MLGLGSFLILKSIKKLEFETLKCSWNAQSKALGDWFFESGQQCSREEPLPQLQQGERVRERPKKG